MVSPAGVSCTSWVLREKRENPSSVSSFCICLLRAGWDTYSTSAAREKFRYFTAVTNCLICVSVITPAP